MRRTVGILSLISSIVSFVTYARWVITGTIVDGNNVREGVFLIFVLFLGGAALAELCLMKDFANLVEKITGERSRQKSNETICFYCGEIIEENSKFCSSCGQEVKKNSNCE